MLNRRGFVARTALELLGLAGVGLSGCRRRPYGHLLRPDQQDLVGSTAAGAATYKPLIETAVAQLLARHGQPVQPVTGLPPQPLRVCFVGVENRSAEELGDFKEQIYEYIDAHIERCSGFRPISKRFVEAALRESHLRPDELFLPKNRRTFAAVLEQKGQPIDYLLFAKITSGTTAAGRDYQRDYLLTLELVNVTSGDYDKETAHLRKMYHH